MNARWFVGTLVAALVGAPRATVAAEQPRTIEIAVTPKGFEPARVKVTKGQPLKRVVTRKTDETCATQIVIAGENIEADLPLDKPVTLSFTPKRTGEIHYACGMDMITGVLEVASTDAADSSAASRTDARDETHGSGGARDMHGMQGMKDHPGDGMHRMPCGCMRRGSGSSGS
jgi:plastocyanin domain-containing protein